MADNNQKQFSIDPDSGAVNVNNEQQAPIFEQNGTFCRVGSTDGGIIEVDLRSMKQKGKEERYVSFKVVGLDKDNNVSETEMFLLDENSFNKLKEFISKLNWND